MKLNRLLPKILICVCGILLGSMAAQGQSRGKLTVQATVQTSVALVNENGQWKVVVANAPDPADCLSQLVPARHETYKAAKTAAKATAFVHANLQVRQNTKPEFSTEDSHRGY